MRRLPPGPNVGTQLRARRLRQAREEARSRAHESAAPEPGRGGRRRALDAGQLALPSAEAWFAAHGVVPFAFQRDVWEHIAAGHSGLLHATTGSGKTYAVYFGLLNKVLIVGCDGCVTVCEAGRLKEAKVLASALRLYFTQAGKQAQIDDTSLTRQCEKEYLAQLSDKMDIYDAVVSLACGCGVQYLAEMYNNKIVYPGVDTCFMGVNEERGLYAERCQACGRCILAETGGVCPIARCSKRMLNGPCGGSDKGKCEVNKDVPCGWELIYERLKTLGQLDRFEKPVDPKDWTSSRVGGIRKIIREDLRISAT